MNPTEFISDEEEEERIRMRKRKILTYLIDFRSYLISENYSPNSINQYMTTIRTFYGANFIELPPIRNKQVRNNETLEDLPSKDDIKMALKYANIKYTAILLLLSSSGMGSGELLSLKYSDFVKSLKDYIKLPNSSILDIGLLSEMVAKKQSDNELIISTWKIQRKKTKVSYVTFSTIESINAILDYLKIYPPESLESPLFRIGKTDKILGERTFHDYFKWLNDKCKFGKHNYQIKFRSHAVGRKYFTNILYSKGLPQLSIDWFLGHRINSTTNAYFKSNINDLKEQYISCIKREYVYRKIRG